MSLGDRPIEEQEAFWAAMRKKQYKDMTPEEQYEYRLSDNGEILFNGVPVEVGEKEDAGEPVVDKPVARKGT